eukprot:jgi/Bigna1/82583/fgenesh1_pg.94_\
MRTPTNPSNPTSLTEHKRAAHTSSMKKRKPRKVSASPGEKRRKKKQPQKDETDAKRRPKASLSNASLISGAGIFNAGGLSKLNEFANSKDHLGIVHRGTPAGSKTYFRKLVEHVDFDEALGIVCKSHAKDDLRRILAAKIPKKLRGHDFYETWLSDMTEVCKTFCDVLKSKAVSFWVGSDRGCVRYHVDWVPFRMLVTYHGKGTELLPDGVADREAFLDSNNDNQVVEDPNAVKFMRPWDIALFRGGPDGVVHRTPDSALDAPTILMRLDRKEFLDAILEQEDAA